MKFKSKKAKEKFILTLLITVLLIVTILLLAIDLPFLQGLFTGNSMEMARYIGISLSIIQGIVIIVYTLVGENSFKFNLFMITLCYIALDFNVLLLKYS